MDIKRIILYLSITLMAGIVFPNIYTSIVDAPIWSSNIPESIEISRSYYANLNPAHFFRILTPISHVLAILVLILFWKSSKKVRLYFGLGLLFSILMFVITIRYFWPRNEIIFNSDITTNLSAITNACEEWETMNWVRSFIGLAGLTFQFMGLNKVSSQ